MRKSLRATVAIVAITIFTLPTAYAADFTMGAGENTGLSGVSPFAMTIDASSDRVFYSGGLNGLNMATCPSRGQCPSPATLPMSFGSDYTQVTLTNGSQRAYFVNINPDTRGKSISTALVTYSNGTPSLGATADLGFSVSAEQRAWGVPDSTLLPDGRVRLYWVTTPASSQVQSGATAKQVKCLVKKLGKSKVKKLSKGANPRSKDKKALKKCKVNLTDISAGNTKTPEVIVSATSTDSTGTQFVSDAGYRFTGGFVDPEIVQAKTGNWIALLSTGPGAPPQRLYVATSQDGLAWRVHKTALTSTSVDSLDPTTVRTGPNTWRVYYAQSPKASPLAKPAPSVGSAPSAPAPLSTNYTLLRATLRR